VLINGAVVEESLSFPHTDKWYNWTISDSFAVDFPAGDNQIRIEAVVSEGLGNYDYLIVSGDSLSDGECIPSYILEVDQNEADWGMVSYEPVQEYYTEGTEVTLTAQAKPGYFFQSWSGDEPSVESVFKFTVTKNVHATAIFLPEGTQMHPDAAGYAAVQDDKGTPYMIIGGALGDSVHASSAEELESYLGSDLPLVVTFADSFFGTQKIGIKSNKTLLGIGDGAHLEGIELAISDASNVIVKNITISKVIAEGSGEANDAVQINRASNVWVDHCEFYSDREHGKDYYDGLLDIKNEASFITISWSKFHDHYKTILISSNDQSPQDSVTRVTFHHNYFYNCGSRLPSIRFGTAHIFNNYYKNCDSGINSRMGACVRVEKNYFYHTRSAVNSEYSSEPGAVELIDNIFESSGYNTNLLTCELEVPYAYEHILDEAKDIPMLIAGDVTAIEERPAVPIKYSVSSYPNPFNPEVNIKFTLPETGRVKLDIYNALGQKTAELANGKFNKGEHILKWNAGGFSSGVYFYRIAVNSDKTAGRDFQQTKKMLLIR
jgi:pectate lyase